MNIIKATIATAAVTVCCLGNEMPARAYVKDTFIAGYHYGFSYGSVSMACLNYQHRLISRSTMLMQMRAAANSDKTTRAIKDQIIENFESMAANNDDPANCLSAVRQIFGRKYQSADYWR